MINLNTYSWNDKLNQLRQGATYNTLFHGQTIIINRTYCEIIFENELFLCELTKNMIFVKSKF